MVLIKKVNGKTTSNKEPATNTGKTETPTKANTIRDVKTDKAC